MLVVGKNLKNNSMGFFDFLKPQPQNTSLSFFAKRLTDDQKASIYLTMIVMTTLGGQRKAHPAELKFIGNIKDKILSLSDNQLNSLNIKKLNFPSINASLGQTEKDYFAGIYFNLANIVGDNTILQGLSVVLEDMGLTIEEVKAKQQEIINEMNQNPYL